MKQIKPYMWSHISLRQELGDKAKEFQKTDVRMVSSCHFKLYEKSFSTTSDPLGGKIRRIWQCSLSEKQTVLSIKEHFNVPKAGSKGCCGRCLKMLCNNPEKRWRLVLTTLLCTREGQWKKISGDIFLRDQWGSILGEMWNQDRFSQSANILTSLIKTEKAEATW